MGARLETKVVNVDSEDAIEESLKELEKGNVIAVPTETVYGLVCDINNIKAVEEIYNLKQRDFTKPLAAFCANFNDVEKIADTISPIFRKLAEKYYPGPITIVTEKKNTISNMVTAQKGTIGIRIPDNKFILKLTSKYPNSLASTSANISNSQSLNNANDVLNCFRGKIPLIIDGGNAIYGIASTVIDISVTPPRLIREGSIKYKEIIDYLNKFDG